jgi:hypothetical protein
VLGSLRVLGISRDLTSFIAIGAVVLVCKAGKVKKLTRLLFVRRNSGKFGDVHRDPAPCSGPFPRPFGPSLGSRVATLGRDPFLKPTAAIFLKFFQIFRFFGIL